MVSKTEVVDESEVSTRSKEYGTAVSEMEGQEIEIK